MGFRSNWICEIMRFHSVLEVLLLIRRIDRISDWSYSNFSPKWWNLSEINKIWFKYNLIKFTYKLNSSLLMNTKLIPITGEMRFLKTTPRIEANRVDDFKYCKDFRVQRAQTRSGWSFLSLYTKTGDWVVRMIRLANSSFLEIMSFNFSKAFVLESDTKRKTVKFEVSKNFRRSLNVRTFSSWYFVPSGWYCEIFISWILFKSIFEMFSEIPAFSKVILWIITISPHVVKPASNKTLFIPFVSH